MAYSSEEYIATIEGEQLTINVLGENRIAVNRQEHVHDMVQSAPGEYSLLLDGRSFRVSVDELDNDGDQALQESYSITLNGHNYTVRIDDKRSLLLKLLSGAENPSTGSSILHSPMPGLVVKVEVQKGEEVSAGQGLIVLEAMKMENELKATRKGKVTDIHVTPGLTVEKGEKLITLANS